MATSRDACDRCHSMKTRCERLPISRMCQRCDRLGVSCNYSPPGRTGRPQGSRRAKNKLLGRTVISQTQADGTQNNQHSEVRIDEYGLITPLPVGENSSLTDDTFLDQLDQQASWPDIDLYSPETCFRIDAPPSFTGLPPPNPPVQHNVPDLTRSISPAFSPSSTLHACVEEVSEAPRPRRVHSLDEDDQLHRLLYLQTKLVGLAKSFRASREQQSHMTPPSSYDNDDSFKLSEAVEEIYRATETFMDILKVMWKLEDDEKNIDPRLEVPGGERVIPLSSLAQPHGATVLLSSSCYFSLIHLYELLVEMLREKPQEKTRQYSRPLSNDLPSSNRSSSHSTTKAHIPTINIGRMQVPIPEKLVLEIHFHLIVQTVQRLKSTIKLCGSRMGTLIPSGISKGPMGPMDKAMTETECGPESSILGMAHVALSELGQQEEHMISRLCTSNFGKEIRS